MADRETNAPRVMEPDDLYNIHMASDAQISPDGSQVVFVKTWMDKEKNDYRSSLYVVPSVGGELRRLTSAESKDTSPRWATDGRHVAFLSDRAEKKQVFILPLGGGEAWKLTDLAEGVDGFAWSPDGSTIAVVSKSESGETAKENSGDDESDVVHITSIRYKSNGVPGFLDGKRSHIWCVAFPTGDAWQVTSGDFDDTSPGWSISGTEIVFASDRTEDRDYDRLRQIWVVNARGGEPRILVGNDNDSFGNPAPSPDGVSVAFRGHREADAGSGPNQRVWTVPLAGGEPQCLTEDLDRTTADGTAADIIGPSSAGLNWDADGTNVYFQVSDQGSVHLYRTGPGGPPEPVIQGNRRVIDFSLSNSASKIAFAASENLDPAGIYVCDLDGGNEQRLTSINAEFLAGVTLSEPEEFRVRSHNEDGMDVHGWVMKPPGFDSSARYPMILYIHGGPHGQYGHSFFHEFQVLAARGYVVTYCNPRGSEGYGEQFKRCTRSNWGEADMPDFMAAVDHVVEQGYVDPNRLGVTGGSYGGFMTNWIIGHTDRFKAAITDRCVSNLYSMYGTSDIGFTFGEYEFSGKPWIDREQYEKYSPISYVEQMTTPLLIIHSEQDYRCPIEQAEQLFVFLKKLGRTVEFVRFPNENHELSRNGQPKHRIQRLEFNLDWWSRFL